MKKPVRAIVMSLTMLAGSSVAFASPPSHAPAWGYHKDHDHYRSYERNRYDNHGHKHSHKASKYEKKHARYHRGDRLEDRYRNSRYYVNDWEKRHLSKPPRDHRWVDVDGEYLLISIVTGVIASVLLGS